MRSVDGATHAQKLREQRTRISSSKHEATLCTGLFAPAGFVFHGVHGPDDAQCMLRLSEAILVGLEKLSASVGKTSRASTSAEARKRIVATVVIADDNAARVGKHIDRDLASARERELVSRKVLSNKRPHKGLRLLRRQLERRLVRVHDRLRADRRDERLTKRQKFLRPATEEIVQRRPSDGNPESLEVGLEPVKGRRHQALRDHDMSDEACIIPGLFRPALGGGCRDDMTSAAAGNGLAQVHVLSKVRGYERPRHGRLANAHGPKVGARAKSALFQLGRDVDGFLRRDDVVCAKLRLLSPVLGHLLFGAGWFRQRRHLCALLRASLERSRQRFILCFELGEPCVGPRSLFDQVRFETMRVVLPNAALVRRLRIVRRRWRWRRRRSQRPVLIMTRMKCRSPLCTFSARRFPSWRALDAKEIDPVEKHRKRGRIEFDTRRAFRHMRHREASSLETPVVDRESSSVKKEDFHAIHSTTKKDEQCAAIRVRLPHRANQRCQAVVSTA